MVEYTSEQIIENRWKWIKFLQSPERKKAKAVLDRGSDRRCCLGHACFILGIESNRSSEYALTSYDGMFNSPPNELRKMLGLRSTLGYIVDSDKLNIYRTSNDDKLRIDDERYEGETVVDLALGMCLSTINDQTDVTPQDIGDYLERCMNDPTLPSPFLPV